MTTHAQRSAGICVSFTRFEAHGERLSKLYKQALDGKVFKLGGTQMSRGEYETITIEAADPPRLLAEIGTRIDVLNFREAIGLGVSRTATLPTGDIITKSGLREGARAIRARRGPASRGRCRILTGRPAARLGLLLFDGDEKDNLREILIALWPDFAEVPCLVRPSASASVKDPATGERLKAGEHLFVLLDEPAKAKACLEAILRLSWCVGVGRSAGWLGLAKDGDPLVYGPCRRHGRFARASGLRRRGLARQRTGTAAAQFDGDWRPGVLCAAELIAFADQHAPVKQFNELVAAAKNDPAFLAQQAAVKAAYRADHIEKGVAQGKPREEVETRVRPGDPRSGDGARGADLARAVATSRRCTSPTARPFLASEMGADPKAFHGRECADPVEGLDYQSRNPGLILHQGGRVEIYTRAHSDRYAYFLPLYTTEGLGELLREPGRSRRRGSRELNNEADDAKAAKAQEKEAKEKAKQERKEAKEAKAKAKAETKTSAPIASEPPATPPSSLPKWLFVMLGFANKVFGGSKYGPYTNKSTPGETYGPYNGREGLVSAFLIRCVEEGIPDESIIYACINERFKDSKGAIHTHCRKQMKSRGDLEQLIARAKAGDLGDPEDYRGFYNDDDEDDREADDLEDQADSDFNADATEAAEAQDNADAQAEFDVDAKLNAEAKTAEARADADTQAEFDIDAKLNASAKAKEDRADLDAQAEFNADAILEAARLGPTPMPRLNQYRWWRFRWRGRRRRRRRRRRRGSGPQPGFAGKTKRIIK